VAHTCDVNYLEGRDMEDHGLRPAQPNSLGDRISKITKAKWTAGMAQYVK
jgi:hypothetical protein